MQITTSNVAVRLLEDMKALKGVSGSHYALHFHTSSLQEMYRSEFQQRIAVNIVNDVFRNQEGTIYVPGDGDIIVIYEGSRKELLSQAIYQLRYLFADDPIAYHDDGNENENFASTYDLSLQWRAFFRVCTERASVAERLQTQAQQIDDEPEARDLLTPKRLHSIIDELDGIEINYALRKQPICAIKGDIKNIRPVYNEVYINMAHLRKLLSTDCNLTSERWLFRHLTGALDSHVMELLGDEPKAHFNHPVSLNLNLETILSKGFARFATKVQQSVKTTLVVEIHIADVFMDMRGYYMATEILKERGFRICVDGLTNESFTQVSRIELGFDLAKLQWNAEMAGDLDSPHNQKLKDMVGVCGSNRMILCRCDTEHAIDYGHALGITLFQGRHPDRILDPNRVIIN